MTEEEWEFALLVAGSPELREALDRIEEDEDDA